MRRVLFLGALSAGFVAAVLGIQTLATAQFGSGTRNTQPSGSATAQRDSQAEFRASFWKFLKQGAVGYDEWGPFPGKEAGLYEGSSPHGAWLKLFANKTARENPAELPAGSILVKENYGSDKKTLMAVTVMYRSKGYDSEHGDWYWIKFKPDGDVDRTPADKGSMPIAGKFRMCIDCHGGAAGGDYAFVND